ncbi:MAG: DNA methylase [Bacteroidales bacterium]|nr:DNA methylase [Bacteroidales bacterium]
MPERQYLCIDQKSFYATVECVARGLDPMTTNLVVADPDRSENTICLAVSPSMKALGVKNRCRIKDIPGNIKHIVAKPRMQLYIDCAAEIYGVFLKYIAPEDIHVYSIDESFLDVTPYLTMYGMTAKEIAIMIIKDVKDTVGTICTCGIGTNLYLAKIALDIKAKHAVDFIGMLDEETYRNELWDHKPITDFWQIADGKATRLRNHGITTMREVAMMDEDYLYDWFGIDAELLIDHAWGRESTTIADIKAYRSKSKSLSSGQVLMRDYQYEEGLIIAKEMMDQLCLDMAAKKLATDSVSLYVGYSHTQGVPGSGGSAKLGIETNTASMLVPAIETLYRRTVDPRFVIRRVCLSCNNVVEDRGVLQLSMFADTTKQLRDKALQEAMLGIRAKYGKNSILKGMNYDPAATGRERNVQIGGHHA